jgi:hypothetical protein
VTHELGLRYIWIDCLCIIQDDTSDWEIESKRMASIYGNSKATIAAVKSKDGNGGCFNENDKIFYFKHPSSDTPMSIRQYNNHEGHRSFETSDVIRQTMPLFTRAWTLQEEILSPRVLYYESMEVAFQCRKLLDCQCGELSHRGEDYSFETTKRRYERSHHKSLDSYQAMQDWASVVVQFSSRKLTFETDRLPALSGLAKSFQNQHLGAFVAGMWEKGLHFSLSWVYVGPRRAQPTVYVAPSWSWASAGGEIDYPVFERVERWQSHLTILNVACEPAGLDPTGAISSGYIKVRGHPVPATLTTTQKSVGRFWMQLGLWEAQAQLDYIPRRLEVKDPSSTLSVLCLLICSPKEGFSSLRDDHYFLVLIPAEGIGRYKRCGVGFRPVGLTEDYERDVGYPQGVNFSVDLNVRECSFIEWFNNAEEQELILV